MIVVASRANAPLLARLLGDPLPQIPHVQLVVDQLLLRLLWFGLVWVGVQSAHQSLLHTHTRQVIRSNCMPEGGRTCSTILGEMSTPTMRAE